MLGTQNRSPPSPDAALSFSLSPIPQYAPSSSQLTSYYPPTLCASAMAPSTTTDDAQLLQLSPLDAVMGSFGFTILYIFPRPTDAPPFDLARLHTSFRALVEDDYRILLGELHVDPKTGVVSVKQTPETTKPGASRD